MGPSVPVRGDHLERLYTHFAGMSNANPRNGTLPVPRPVPDSGESSGRSTVTGGKIGGARAKAMPRLSEPRLCHCANWSRLSLEQ
jgi:hypothetical protein